ncbi:hypothetical protein CBR_g44615 [Chara braunii]|uniref:Phospholipase/carboxylesterase/thioesterase domain-containing protein n=1 Tax=Chara braunii TaxID=69332 RepID=A0A388LXW7_CHABU|nr:hypothetical protein CBR_g44615 [Chara braunii]|eukprot:GBG87157.1 hypothetical protein CBR_g44615 [Chara braunii]
MKLVSHIFRNPVYNPRKFPRVLVNACRRSTAPRSYGLQVTLQRADPYADNDDGTTRSRSRPLVVRSSKHWQGAVALAGGDAAIASVGASFSSVVRPACCVAGSSGPPAARITASSESAGQQRKQAVATGTSSASAAAAAEKAPRRRTVVTVAAGTRGRRSAGSFLSFSEPAASSGSELASAGAISSGGAMAGTTAASGGADGRALTPWHPAEETIVLPPTADHTGTIVWLHGLGDTGHGWVDLLRMIAMPQIKWVLPTAPIRPIGLNGGFPSTGWFDVKGLSADSPEDVEGLDRAATYVADILEKERQSAEQAGKPSIKLGVGGFSMGGALSLYTVTRMAVGSLINGQPALGRNTLSSAIALSGWLPAAEHLQSATIPAEGKAAAAELPIFMGHGKDDMLVACNWGHLSAAFLQRSGFSKVSFKTYSGVGHGVNPSELADVRQWLLDNFPAAS